jgi:hypothetical protein
MKPAPARVNFSGDRRSQRRRLSGAGLAAIDTLDPRLSIFS